MCIPSQDEFLKLSQKGNLIPVYREVSGDLDTPVSAYFKLASRAQYSFLLESVEGEEKVARYSFLAKDPECIIRSKDNHIEVTTMQGGKQKKKERMTIKDSPLTFIRNLISDYKFVATDGLPRFCGGIVGYLGYDIVRFFEKLPNKPTDDLKLPDILLIMAKHLVIFDHLKHTIKVVHCIDVKPKMPRAAKVLAYKKALASLDKTCSELNKPLTIHDLKTSFRPSKTTYRSNYNEEQFKRMVRTAKRDIHDGEIIQAVLSQRFEVKLKTDPFHIYRMLRSLNPSPYMYFLNFHDVQIVGSSPELLVRCEDGVVETRPIAGTRPRGKNTQEDEFNKIDLLNDPKEKAEHIMLVDLGRNDLGRVCKKGSIYLSEFMSVEKYSHVMHIVSNVKGELRRDKDAFDVLKAAFPAGTVSGAPKIRAMEIIDELENVSRGPYAGCIGYFSFSGNLDSCITIRTIVVYKDKAYVQAGAGIVADSKPHKEYQETINKARAQIMAIEKAHTHFT